MLELLRAPRLAGARFAVPREDERLAAVLRFVVSRFAGRWVAAFPARVPLARVDRVRVLLRRAEAAEDRARVAVLVRLLLAVRVRFVPPVARLRFDLLADELFVLLSSPGLGRCCAALRRVFGCSADHLSSCRLRFARKVLSDGLSLLAAFGRQLPWEWGALPGTGS